MTDSKSEIITFAEGWGEDEGGFRWSFDGSASLTLRGAAGSAVELEFGAYAPGRHTQTILVVANGGLESILRIAGEQTRKVTVVMPDSEMEIWFITNDAISPREAEDVDDDRRLGVRLCL